MPSSTSSSPCEAVLPLFFFHLRTPDGLDRNEDGINLLDLETAYLEACDAIPGLSADLMAEGVSPLTHSFVIADAAGQTLMEVSFSERLRKGQRPIRPSQHGRARLLSQEIADAIDAARETVRQSRAILARAHST